jgi:hypothetical protein
MKILQSVDYKIEVPTDVEELATLLDNYSPDWAMTLDFLCKVGERQGIHIDRRAVMHKMTEIYGFGE